MEKVTPTTIAVAYVVATLLYLAATFQHPDALTWISLGLTAVAAALWTVVAIRTWLRARARSRGTDI